MSNKYKILLTCYDFDRNEPYLDEVIGVDSTETKARYEMMRCVIDELQDLNGILEDGTFPERRFIATMEDEEHDVVINAWDGPDYRPVTCYDIITQTELLKKLNGMLRERHGQHITVKIKSHTNDNGIVTYYFTSRKYGNSVDFRTAVDAYCEANIYLNGVGEIW